MTLPLPYVARDPDAQGNFDKIATAFPLQSQHFANDSVKAAAIATDAVGSAEIAAGAVGAAELATGIVLQLATTGTARKVAFGTDSVTFTASPTSATKTVAHGLGATPSVVLLTALNETANCLMMLFSKDATNIVAIGRESADVNRTGPNTFYWLAIA